MSKSRRTNASNISGPPTALRIYIFFGGGSHGCMLFIYLPECCWRAVKIFGRVGTLTRDMTLAALFIPPDGAPQRKLIASFLVDDA